MTKWTLSTRKSPIYKKCESPGCHRGEKGRPKWFWAHTTQQKYCCPECKHHVLMIQQREYRKRKKRKLSQLSN